MRRADFLKAVIAAVIVAPALPKAPRLALRHRFRRLPWPRSKAHAYYKLTTVQSPNAPFFSHVPNGVDPKYEYISRPYSAVGDVVLQDWAERKVAAYGLTLADIGFR